MTAVAALMLAACGGDAEEPSAEPEPTATEELTEDPTDELTPPGEDNGGNGGGAEPDPTDDLPGTESDLGPGEGQDLVPIGVPFDDVLHVRAAPDATADSVLELQPVDSGVTATGHNREVDDGAIWAEITIDDVTGWANWSYLGYIGDAMDATDDVPRDMTGETVWHLAEQVVNHLYPGDGGDPELEVVLISDAVDDPDASDALVDVLGFADDAQQGARVRVNGNDVGDVYTVEEVVVSPLCYRGVTDGLCL